MKEPIVVSAPTRLALGLWWLFVGGAACAAAAGGIGFALERTRFGSSETAAYERVERSVRAQIDSFTASLQGIASSLAGESTLLASATSDPAAARALVDRADATLRKKADAALAVTVYGATGTPVAWSGHPSDLPLDRITGPEALFSAPGPLGLHLVYLKPVVDPSRGRRIGAVAAERALSSFQGVRTPPADIILLGDTIVPVSVRARYEGAGETEGSSFIIPSPSGEPLLEARVARDALRTARRQWRRGVVGIVLGILAAALVLWTVPLLAWRAAARTRRRYLGAVAAIIAALLGARALLWLALAPERREVLALSQAFGELLRPTHRTSPDFLLTALLLSGLVVLAAHALEQCRYTMRRFRRGVGSGPTGWIGFGVSQAAAALAVAFLIVSYQRFLYTLLDNAPVGVLHVSVHSWNAARLVLSFGLILLHAVVVWTAVLIFLLASIHWRVPRRIPAVLIVFVLRALPLISVLIRPPAFEHDAALVQAGPTMLIAMSCPLLATLADAARARYRHASQALRVASGALVLVVPLLVMYPSVLQFTDRAKRQLIETRLAPEAERQREALQLTVSHALNQIDTMASLPELVSANPERPAPAGAAFQVWSRTELAAARLTSAVELYGADGSLVSRFALNLPEYTSVPQKWREQNCAWESYEEVAPFGSEERVLLHAGRGVCPADPATSGSLGAPSARMVGAVVIHVMLDHNALSFIESRTPRYEFARSAPLPQQESVLGRDLEFVAYGWGRRPIYASSDSAWPLDDTLIVRIASSRRKFWTTLARSGRQYAAYILNDRAGISVLGYPLVTPLDHLVNLAELATLACVGYVLALLAVSIFALLGGRPQASSRALLREIRASFYRKLLLAFVAASVVPVVTLALVTRAFSVAQLRASIESAAIRTAAVAQHVTEELVSLQQRGVSGAPIPDDDTMLWLSRAINQDVNIFEGPRLLATSERDLFASGLLSLRTSSTVYRAIALDRLASFVGEETVGDSRYLLAAAPVRVGGRETILTVPLMFRQQEIERDIDELDRLVLLAALVFILLGAGIGYSMAERIGDPVNRLTRATRRIARGDLTARIAQTSSDELQRLVDDFNRMAADLQQQRAQLERTHRLEAWADMARQVAHEIKNPLTPIQLSAEHLRRLHRDRGEPLAPALQECVDVILSQVTLLRQISAEFSSFASSPTPHPSPTSLADLVATVVEPYRAGLGTRIAIRVDVPNDLPRLALDRTLLARALTNIIENSLHAMPGGGTLTIAAGAAGPAMVRLSVSDTGEGMDEEAMRRVFEPYFSTRGTGTGLGLTIAKRNVELNGGVIDVQSTKGEGTVVTIQLPVDTAGAAGVRPAGS